MVERTAWYTSGADIVTVCGIREVAGDMCPWEVGDGAWSRTGCNARTWKARGAESRVDHVFEGFGIFGNVLVDVSVEIFNLPVDDGGVVMLEEGFEHIGGRVELVHDFDVEWSKDIAIPGGTHVDLTDWHVDGERQAGLAERKAWKELHFEDFDERRVWRMDAWMQKSAVQSRIQLGLGMD